MCCRYYDVYNVVCILSYDYAPKNAILIYLQVAVALAVLGAYPVPRTRALQIRLLETLALQRCLCNVLRVICTYDTALAALNCAVLEIHYIWHVITDTDYNIICALLAL